MFLRFIHQHVGIGNAKSSRWGSNPKPGPNASGFVSQWNIGFSDFIFLSIGIAMNILINVKNWFSTTSIHTIFCFIYIVFKSFYSKNSFDFFEDTECSLQKRISEILT